MSEPMSERLSGGAPVPPPETDAPRSTPTAGTGAAAADRYERMTRLADLFDRHGAELRERARLGQEILTDDDVAASAALSPRTWEAAEDAIRVATTGRRGLLPNATELDADALVVRATVLTYRWLDDLAATAARTLGAIAGRAVDYLAPEVELGGAVVAAGLIETDTEDREGVAAYLAELAEQHPDLMDHVTTAGGLLDGLQLRSLLTHGLASPDDEPGLARVGLRAAGVASFDTDAVAAVRDVAGDLMHDDTHHGAHDPAGPGRVAVGDPAGDLPQGLEGLMTRLSGVTSGVEVHRSGAGRYVVYLTGREPGASSRLRLVGGDLASYAEQAARVVAAALYDRGSDTGAEPEEAPRLLLVGGGSGGAAALDLAALLAADHRRAGGAQVDAVVTVGAPPRPSSAAVAGGVRLLALEDSADPVALLSSLIAGEQTRNSTQQGAVSPVSVVFDAGTATGAGAWVAGGRAADAATHAGLRDELAHLVRLGYLRD